MIYCSCELLYMFRYLYAHRQVSDSANVCLITVSGMRYLSDF
jgi:hypothetical protein